MKYSGEIVDEKVRLLHISLSSDREKHENEAKHLKKQQWPVSSRIRHLNFTYWHILSCWRQNIWRKNQNQN